MFNIMQLASFQKSKVLLMDIIVSLKDLKTGQTKNFYEAYWMLKSFEVPYRMQCFCQHSAQDADEPLMISVNPHDKLEGVYRTRSLSNGFGDGVIRNKSWF